MRAWGRVGCGGEAATRAATLSSTRLHGVGRRGRGFGGMSAFSEAALEKKLSELSNSQQSVQTLSLWLIHHRKHSRPIVTVWERELRKGERPGASDPGCRLPGSGVLLPAPSLSPGFPLPTPNSPRGLPEFRLGSLVFPRFLPFRSLLPGFHRRLPTPYPRFPVIRFGVPCSRALPQAALFSLLDPSISRRTPASWIPRPFPGPGTR